MQLKQIEVAGYRSLESVCVPLSRLTSLIGPNGSGKSSLLGALRLFFEPSRGVDELDFWTGSADHAADQISINVTWTEVDPDAEVFAAFLDETDELTVERRFEEPGQGLYLARRMAVPEFSTIRNLRTGHRDSFHQLVESGRFEGLSKVANKGEVFEEMARWEEDNPERCEEQQETFEPLHELLEEVSFLYIAAFEDPREHLDTAGGGAISRLIERAVDRSIIQTGLEAVADDAAAKSNEILREASERLDEFSDSVASRLDSFAPGCRISLEWEEAAVRRAEPRLKVSIQTSDGLRRPIEYQGQGVQRALMYAALTAEASGTDGDEGALILVVEEPEAFQHPLSCRVLARTLRELSGRKYQIAYSTHSPEFVHSGTIDGLRIFRRDDRTDRGAATHVESLAGVQLLDEWKRVFQGDDYTIESVLGRLNAHLSPHVLEGLFARRCILVEGDEDEALIGGAALQRGIDLDAAGVAVIQTNGKPGMPNVLSFLSLAGVLCYPIFDLDRSKAERKQHRAAERQILRALEMEEPVEAGVHRAYACWHDDFGKSVEQDLGEQHREFLEDAAGKFGYDSSQGRKVPVVIAEVLRMADEAGLRSETLDLVAERLTSIVEDVEHP